MSRRKGTKPEQFAGVFQNHEEIPVRYRLETYAQSYRDHDTWSWYLDNVLFNGGVSDYIYRTAKRVERSWLAHMEQYERHHALPTPEDANEWCIKLRENRNRKTAYEKYYVYIYNFFEHLKSHSQHPHLYNPLLIAAIQYEETRDVWQHRIESRPEVVGRE